MFKGFPFAFALVSLAICDAACSHSAPSKKESSEVVTAATTPDAATPSTADETKAHCSIIVKEYRADILNDNGQRQGFLAQIHAFSAHDEQSLPMVQYFTVAFKEQGCEALTDSKAEDAAVALWYMVQADRCDKYGFAKVSEEHLKEIEKMAETSDKALQAYALISMCKQLDRDRHGDPSPAIPYEGTTL